MAVRTVLFNIEALQDRLIAQRVKFAKRKHDAVILAGYTKDKSQPKKKNTKAQARFREDLRIFRKIMPSRRSWVHLDEKSRYGGKQNCRITSIDQNKKALELTFKRDCKNAAEYMLLQKNVLRGLRKQILRRKYEFSEPKISGTIKNKKELRPVCSFPIFDNIILQECNRILSTWFDPYFCASSYAFRVKYEHKKAPTHHDTILKILEYLSMHQGETIYVAECDLQKFFDTINHERIISCFANFLEQVPKPKSEKRMLEHLFFSYLRCYDYQKSVKPLNSNQEFLKKAKNRRFVWIKEELLLEKYGEAYSEQEIGVPQGGALSGLIANIVLHQVDYALEQLNDSDLLYLRFCDDMIMLHTNETDLNVAFSLYQEKLNENLLFIHEPKMIKDYSSQYYKVKSKAPFAFGPLDEGKIPWITFVGYDISHLKEVRVRKSTVEKQIKKQEEVVGKVIRTVKESERPIERKKTIESVRSRLIGMSVGRIVLWEDNAIKEMCWAKGFPCLTKNPYSIRQIKRLDRSRAKQIDRLYKKLPPDIVHDKDKDNDPQDKPKGKRKHKNRPIIYYGKPFSYYYWLEKKDEESNGK